MNNYEPVSISSPLTLQNGIQVKNRLFKSAMSEQLGDRHHNPTKALITLYETWAEGGIGLSMTGNVMIDRRALGEPKNVVLDDNSDLEQFEAWSAAGKKQNTQFWMQLNHPGKQTPKFLTKQPVAPSSIALGAGLERVFNMPRELTETEIFEIIEKFGISARLAKKAGFSGVQIHGAHGYLISQFLSPHHNQRSDQWGGSIENRARFVIEVYREIRNTVGRDYPVGIKMNSADFMKSGFLPEDSLEVAKLLEAEGIDLIEISGGTYESPSMTGAGIKKSTSKREAYFLEYAEKLRNEINTPIVVTGGFRSAQAMQDAITSGATEMIGLARPLAVEPDFPKKILSSKDYKSGLKRPTTGIAFVDRMTMLDITWYEYQLCRIGGGKSADPELNAWKAVFQTFSRMGVHAFTKRRA